MRPPWMCTSSRRNPTRIQRKLPGTFRSYCPFDHANGLTDPAPTLPRADSRQPSGRFGLARYTTIAELTSKPTPPRSFPVHPKFAVRTCKLGRPYSVGIETIVHGSGKTLVKETTSTEEREAPVKETSESYELAVVARHLENYQVWLKSLCSDRPIYDPSYDPRRPGDFCGST